MISLESLAACFQGLIPAWLYTCSRDGIPNSAILSHVDYVDSRHIALSFQFFNKSKRNIMENPKAMIRVYNPDTFEVYMMRLRYVRTETVGPIFESMRLRIEAIASYSGLKGIFKLLGADVYEVLSVTKLKHEIGVLPSKGKSPASAKAAAGAPFTMKALQELLDQIHGAPTLDCLLDSILETLENIFGFRHSMILLPLESTNKLELIASRGYPEGGIGSEVAFGEGIIGVVAEAQKPIRISGMLRQFLYADAVAKRAQTRGLCTEERRIPLPGLLNPGSQLGIPLLVRNELIGVLCIESNETYRFHEEDRSYLEVLGGYLALAIQNAVLKERSDDGEELPPKPAGNNGKSQAVTERSKIEVTYYQADENLFVDREYLVRGVPAKILRKILREYQTEQRVEFTNRLIRLDKSLALPDYKDNLESRLILLRRRLEERCPEIKIAHTGRGRFRLELDSEITLVDLP